MAYLPPDEMNEFLKYRENKLSDSLLEWFPMDKLPGWMSKLLTDMSIEERRKWMAIPRNRVRLESVLGKDKDNN